jgi:hypothetical protein
MRVRVREIIFDRREEFGRSVASGVVCEVLTQLGIKAVPLRVTAKVFHPEPRKYGCVLGSDGGGERMPAAGRDKWHGHLVSLVTERFLVDTTLDQARDNHRWLKTTPVAIDLRSTKWFHGQDLADHWTGNLALFADGVTVSYEKYRNQKGWQSAGDFRPRRRREIVRHLAKLAGSVPGLA